MRVQLQVQQGGGDSSGAPSAGMRALRLPRGGDASSDDDEPEDMQVSITPAPPSNQSNPFQRGNYVTIQLAGAPMWQQPCQNPAHLVCAPCSYICSSLLLLICRPPALHGLSMEPGVSFCSRLHISTRYCSFRRRATSDAADSRQLHRTLKPIPSPVQVVLEKMIAGGSDEEDAAAGAALDSEVLPPLPAAEAIAIGPNEALLPIGSVSAVVEGMLVVQVRLYH